MSRVTLDAVREYATVQLMDLGLAYHAEAFDVESIPRTKLKQGAFHITLGSDQVVSRNVNNEIIDTPVTVHVLMDGFSANTKRTTEALERGTEIRRELTAQDNIDGSGIIQMYFDSQEVGPFDPQNDNIVSLKLGFRARRVRALG
jgi:hypothetical protein